MPCHDAARTTAPAFAAEPEGLLAGTVRLLPEGGQGLVPRKFLTLT